LLGELFIKLLSKFELSTAGPRIQCSAALIGYAAETASEKMWGILVLHASRINDSSRKNALQQLEIPKMGRTDGSSH
jgi:hypothetical protein